MLCSEYTRRRISASAIASGIAIGRKSGACQCWKMPRARSSNTSAVNGNTSRLTLPAPILEMCEPGSPRNLTLRSTDHATPKHTRTRTSSIQPAGVLRTCWTRSSWSGATMAASLLSSLRLLCFPALEHRGKEAVTAVPVRIEPQQAPVERDIGEGKLGSSVAQRELGMRCQKAVDDCIVLRGQDAAGRVHDAAAWFAQRCSRRENARLLGGKLVDCARRVAPLEIGIPAERAEAAAGCIDQNAIDLAGEPLDVVVALVLDQHGMNVRQTRAGETRFEVREASR